MCYTFLLSRYCSASRQKKNLVSTATGIIPTVRETLATYGVSTGTVVGHTLGAAIAILDGVYFKVQFGTSVQLQVICYSLPRLGNQAFANWINSNLSGLVTPINNKEDLTPTVPDISLGFSPALGRDSHRRL